MFALVGKIAATHVGKMMEAFDDKVQQLSEAGTSGVAWSEVVGTGIACNGPCENPETTKVNYNISVLFQF